jgi:hypothetical protein
MMLTAPMAAAQQNGVGIGIVNGCMDDLFLGNLGCTANDVRVSGVADVTGDGIVDEDDITFAPLCDAGAWNAGDDCSSDPNICLDGNLNSQPGLCGDRCAFAGDTTQFAATFIVELSAQERYDIGLYFSTDGDDSDGDGIADGDGALFGECWIGTLPESGTFTRPGEVGDVPFVDLDTTCTGKNCPQPDDLCGDIDDDSNPIFYDTSALDFDPNPAITQWVRATCVDTDSPPDGKLNLPSCTSWRQSGANELCVSPLEAFPGSPSKCNCDPGFQVPILIPAELDVVKTANPTSINEPSAEVIFNISVTNTGADPNNDVTLNSLTDDIYGDITKDQTSGNTLIISTGCSVPQILTGNGGTYTCSFRALVSGNGGDSVTDTVTAVGVDENFNGLSGTDDATVTINDLQPAISVDKDADYTAVVEGSQTLVTFTVTVNNDSPGDALTITSLTDSVYGDLSGKGNCSVPQTIPLGGGPYTCSFTAVVDGQAVQDVTNVVTAVGQDDEGNQVSATDDHTIMILDSPATITLTKTADPISVNENELGNDVEFTLVVANTSDVDVLTITSLEDERPSPGGLVTDLDGVCLDAQDQTLIGQTIQPGGSLSCTFTETLYGEGGTSEIDKATVKALDDDIPSPNELTFSDTATVTFVDVPPAASLSKTATMVVATFDVVVTNDSSAEALTLDALSDDQFCDITQVHAADFPQVGCGEVVATTCGVGGSIAVGGSYTCSFDGKINAADLDVNGDHTDTVTGTVSDNDGGNVTPSDSATVSF